MTDPIRHDKGGADGIGSDDTDRIPPPSPDEDLNGLSAADSFEEDTRNQLNLLRERTFNSELRQLVDRVRENEPGAGVFDSETEDVGMITDDELQLKFYRLYYRARVLNDNREMNISFNPFGLIENTPVVSYRDSIAGYIRDRMDQLAFSPFALLSYSIAEKGYIPTIHNLERYRVENIVIGLRDPLFRMILDNSDGAILEPDTLRDDPFLEKIFCLLEGEEHRALYFIMLGSVVSDVAHEMLEPGQELVTPFLPSSLLMMELPLQTAAYNRHSIASTLRKKLGLPLFLMNDNQSLVFESENYEDMDYSYRVLDYLFTIFMIYRDRIGISIMSQSRDDTSRTFIMKYILSQLGYKLHADSVLIHIIKGHLIILTRESFVGLIRSLIDEYNKLFKDGFQVVEFRPEEFDDSLDIIQKIILKNKK